VTSEQNQLQLDDIQAHIIRTAGAAAAQYYFLTVVEPQAFAAFLRSDAMAALLISDRDYHLEASGQQEGSTRLAQGCFANLAFTHRGLVRMGLDPQLLGWFPPAFSAGMANRACFIGDQNHDAPLQWQGFFGSEQLHVMLVIQYAPRLAPDWKGVPKQWSKRQRKQHFAAISECVSQLLNGAAEFPGTRCLMQEQSHTIRHEGQIREHFGFVDGISQPWVDHGGDSLHRRGGGKLVHKEGDSNDAKPDWQPLAAGEFILGYYDELGLKNQPPLDPTLINPLLPVPADPERARYHALTHNGSFLVYRKLEQDVAGFRVFCSDDARLAAQMVGRTIDGKPLLSHKTSPGFNEFDYADDPAGQHCPFSSHVRRSNPRLTLSKAQHKTTEQVDQHRIIRRGMPYGSFIKPKQQAPVHGKKKRGLHFICYNARIDSQFEFIQRNWLNSSDFLAMPSNVPDPLVASRASNDIGQVCRGREQQPAFGMQQYIHLKGGDYFFAPGLAGLEQILQQVKPFNPLAVPPRSAQEWDPESSDPIKVTPYLLPQDLLAGSRYKQFEVKAADHVTNFYYFGHPEDVVKILGDPARFTNDLYRKKILALTQRDMLLSAPDTEQRRAQKASVAGFLNQQLFMAGVQAALRKELKSISRNLQKQGELELVEGLARRLPLTIIKKCFGIKAPRKSADGILSKMQIAQYFNRDDFDDLPPDWKQNYASEYGFVSTPDDTLLFWIRMLFLEVFLNQYNVSFVAEQAAKAMKELEPHLNWVIDTAMKHPAGSDTLLQAFITMYRQQPGLDDAAVQAQVRQSLLELLVGGTDTAAKAIVQVIHKLLQFGEDLRSGLATLLSLNPAAGALWQQLFPQWLQAVADKNDTLLGQLEPQLDGFLDGAITNCLRMDPVAPLIPRLCPADVSYETSTGEQLEIAAGSVVCVVPKITLAGNLLAQVPSNKEIFVFMDGMPHACLGHQIAMLELREALKMLLQLPAVRPAAGQAGQLQQQYELPREMWLRCGGGAALARCAV